MKVHTSYSVGIIVVCIEINKLHEKCLEGNKVKSEKYSE